MPILVETLNNKQSFIDLAKLTNMENIKIFKCYIVRDHYRSLLWYMILISKKVSLFTDMAIYNCSLSDTIKCRSILDYHR